MAEKRMFSRVIIESDDFQNQSKDARLLYFNLCLNADDEGLLNNTGTVMRMCGCSAENLAELISNGYVLPVIAKVYAITHWYIHNTIPKDRFHKTIIVEWQRYLTLEDKVYQLKTRIS